MKNVTFIMAKQQVWKYSKTKFLMIKLWGGGFEIIWRDFYTKQCVEPVGDRVQQENVGRTVSEEIQPLVEIRT